MNIGIDYHGVITASPNLFSTITKFFRSGKHEVHIITGSRRTSALIEQLREYGISWSHFFSITDYHHSLGTPMTGYHEGQPKIDGELWNGTKAWYCQKNNIDLHIDDSSIYGKYFITPYCQYKHGSENDLLKFLGS